MNDWTYPYETIHYGPRQWLSLSERRAVREHTRALDARPFERIPRPDDYDRATDRSDRELDARRDAELDDWFGEYDVDPYDPNA